MKNWIKRKLAYMFAGDEMLELERWRVMSEEQRRWLAEFPEVAMALDNLIADGKGLEGMHIQVLREKMREHRTTRLHMEYERGRSDGFNAGIGEGVSLAEARVQGALV